MNTGNLMLRHHLLHLLLFYGDHSPWVQYWHHDFMLPVDRNPPPSNVRHFPFLLRQCPTMVTAKATTTIPTILILAVMTTVVKIVKWDIQQLARALPPSRRKQSSSGQMPSLHLPPEQAKHSLTSYHFFVHPRGDNAGRGLVES